LSERLMTGRDQLRPAEEEFRAGVAEMGTRGRCQQIRTRFGLGDEKRTRGHAW
jgi:hypothetical protein